MSTPTNGKSPTGPLRTTTGASRTTTNGAARTATGKTTTVPGASTKRPATTPLAARTSTTSTARSVRDTTSPRASGRSASRRQQETRQEQLRKYAPLFGVLGIVLAAVIIFVVISNNSTTPPLTAAGKAKVITATTSVTPAIFDKIKTGGIKNPFQKVSPTVPLYVNSKGLPVVLYVGGQFCPFCAAERWSIVSAFSRFGTFSGLDLISSSESNISTFDFAKSTYTSQYVDLQAIEVLDQNSQPLHTLTAEQQKVFDTYDGPPYSPTKSGVPFISYGNQFVTISSGYSPEDISGLTWDNISGTLTDPTNPIALKILGNANYLTAAVCTLTKDQPASVCKTQTTQDIEKTIKG
ncbi:MAG: DUF929 family protein [Ktedonobacterales bacterium]|nr:DUF929 family protein [Ktedonobacterales bacterium]